MAAPEDWTEQRVQVRLDLGGGRTVPGVLDEVSDRGVVLRNQIVDEGERPVFYPWRLVQWIYPTEGPEEEPGGEDSKEAATDTRRRQWGASDTTYRVEQNPM